MFECHGLVYQITRRKKMFDIAKNGFNFLSDWIWNKLTKRNEPVVICFEGNIGVGKSTLIQNLCNSLDRVMAMTEPIEKWQCFHGVNMLDMYYNDKVKWGYLLQCLIQTTLLEHFLQMKKNARGNNIIFMERSVTSAKEFFVPMMKSKGLLTDLESKVLTYQCDVNERLSQPDVVVYLRGDPNDCLSHIQERGRKEERAIDIGYLEKLHELHEEWYERQKDRIILLDCWGKTQDEILCEMKCKLQV